MDVPVWTVDAFADRRFSGNPASVCLLSSDVPAQTLQAVAAEMNHSETAFLREREDHWDLRWFTPSVEVALCGHATLASAHVLWESGRLARDVRATFQTASGILTAAQEDDRIVLDFPLEPAEPIPEPEGLAHALGAEVVRVGQNRMDLLAELADERTIASLDPDLARLAAYPVRGTIVTARAETPGVDFVSRFFAPQSGVDEDPVTGSAHCALAPWWSERIGRTAMTGRQLSARGGVVGVRLSGARVHLLGRCITVVEGRLIL
ncbi:MAG TPA: PhzF family phenazine biosynthesis protein [Candidatus Polarisedimenticolaceae bacterium]|nr:PhzF family phenazine biosynthesis protein [Candidatus Polarisedimenticolaceae bacterium]